MDDAVQSNTLSCAVHSYNPINNECVQRRGCMTAVRANGIRKLMIGTLGAIGIGVVFYLISRTGYAPTSFALIPFAFPGVYALTGILEIIAGVPFMDLADRWDSLAGWQRGILGTLIVMLALAAAVCGMAVINYW
jgi:hypothetical protein